MNSAMTEQPKPDSVAQENAPSASPEKLTPQPRRPRAAEETNATSHGAKKTTRPVSSPAEHKPGIPEAKRGVRGTEPIRSHAPLPKVNAEVSEANRTILVLMGGILCVALLVAVGNFAYSKGHADGLRVSNAPRPSAVMPIGLAKELEQAVEQLQTEGFPLALGSDVQSPGRLRPFEILVAKAALETGVLTKPDKDETVSFLEAEGERLVNRKELFDTLQQAREKGDREEVRRLMKAAEGLPLASPAEKRLVWDTLALIIELEGVAKDSASSVLESYRGLARLLGQAYLASLRGEKTEAMRLMEECRALVEPEEFEALARDPAFRAILLSQGQ
ncbi:MAG: hypothetical protein SNJ52_04875 [Verrucomicrobiia bacterium]